jgi:magnesium transporter
MTTDYAWLPATLRAGEAVTRLRQQAPNSETIYYVYILDEATRKLLGVASLRELILAPPAQPIRELMEEELHTLKATDDRDKAAQELARYDFLAMPVVDDEGRLVGIVTHDDVIDVVVEQATEDVHRLGGLGPMGENYLEANFVRVWRNRAFWLAFLFVAQMLTFNALAHFEGAMKSVFVLVFFVPLITSTGGNSGSQAATLITRAMALGQVGPGQVFKILKHELFMGLALGATLALIGFIRAWLTPDKLLVNDDGSRTDLTQLMYVIALSVGAICVWGTLVGALLPITFRRLGIDPGVASSPFVATFVDVTGIVIYFSIAKLMLMG